MAKRITVSKQQTGKLVHIEAPGCIVNIRVGLSDIDGREVTAVEILPDRDRAPGEFWSLADDRRAVAMIIRVVKDK
jgi:hypothetical protein